jgi:hypothetical protein
LADRRTIVGWRRRALKARKFDPSTSKLEADAVGSFMNKATAPSMLWISGAQNRYRAWIAERGSSWPRPVPSDVIDCGCVRQRR